MSESQDSEEVKHIERHNRHSGIWVRDIDTKTFTRCGPSREQSAIAKSVLNIVVVLTFSIALSFLYRTTHVKSIAYELHGTEHKTSIGTYHISQAGTTSSSSLVSTS